MTPPSQIKGSIVHANLEVVAWRWNQTAEGQIGLLLCRDTVTKELKGFMGFIPNMLATTEFNDLNYIASWGAKLPYYEFRGFFPVEINEHEYDAQSKKTSGTP